MSDVYAINVSKTEFREGYNNGDVDRVMAVFQPDGFTDMSEGEPSKYGTEASAVWRKRLAELFEEYSVKLTPIIINIVVLGNTAYDYGWHELTLVADQLHHVSRAVQNRTAVRAALEVGLHARAQLGVDLPVDKIGDLAPNL